MMSEVHPLFAEIFLTYYWRICHKSVPFGTTNLFDFT